MTILPHINQSNYLNQLQLSFSEHIKTIKEPHNQLFDISNYADTIESLSSLYHEFCRNTLINSLSEIDQAFKKSELRKRDYLVHNKRERTIITVFGVVTFSRTIYKSRNDGKSFIYLDRKLGLPKWTKYDPCIKAMIYELYADQNSMIKVGSIIGDRIYSSFSNSKDRHQFNISRQTVYNIVKDSLLTKQSISPVENTPKKLYIMADEKYVHTQEDDNDAMIKVAVIFEEVLQEGSRNVLVNKTVYASLDSHFWEDVYDIVSEKYDIESIEDISIMGDGAHWIKAGERMFSQGTFILDKFHYRQSLNRITKDKAIKEIMHSNIINKNKKTFIEVIDILIEEEPKESRKITIEKNKRYILNNWKAIQRSYEVNQIGCSMESAISHMFASVFSNRPKGYKKNNLKRYLNNRVQYLNNIDLRKYYLNTLAETRSEDYHTPTENLDFSMFEQSTDYHRSSISNWMSRNITKF